MYKYSYTKPLKRPRLLALTHDEVPLYSWDMSYYRTLGYRGHLDYYDRYHPVYHPYDGTFYGSRWYDYPTSLYYRDYPGLYRGDYTYRVPPLPGSLSKYRASSDYGYTYPRVYPSTDPYGLHEPRYHLLFDDELKTLPKYSKYNKYPLKMYY